jgi:hypothetical protein
VEVKVPLVENVSRRQGHFQVRIVAKEKSSWKNCFYQTAICHLRTLSPTFPLGPIGASDRICHPPDSISD